MMSGPGEEGTIQRSVSPGSGPKWVGVEKRRGERTKVNFVAKALPMGNSHESSEEVTVIDISDGGLAYLCHHLLEVGTCVEIQFEDCCLVCEDRNARNPGIFQHTRLHHRRRRSPSTGRWTCLARINEPELCRVNWAEEVPKESWILPDGSLAL